MASTPALGHYVAQVIALEDDCPRLLHHVQQHVARGHAMSGAVYTALSSSWPHAVERRRVIAAKGARRISDLAQPRTSEEPPCGDLTLTLLSIDTTWRFDSFYHRVFSPSLTWPAIRKFFKPGASQEADLILQESHQSEAGIVVSPPAHILHVEISSCVTSDAFVAETFQAIRKSFPSSSRQLLFASDPAQNHAPHAGSAKHVLMQEFDARHSAEAIASTHAYMSLSRLSGEHGTAAFVRVFSLAGSATYHDATPRNPSEQQIDNRTHSENITTKWKEDETYFGLRPEQYIHL